MVDKTDLDQPTGGSGAATRGHRRHWVLHRVSPQMVTYAGPPLLTASCTSLSRARVLRSHNRLGTLAQPGRVSSTGYLVCLSVVKSSDQSRLRCQLPGGPILYRDHAPCRTGAVVRVLEQSGLPRS